MISLNTQQENALSEIFNIGMARAASSLSRLAGDEIELAVPRITVVKRQEAAKILAAAAGERVCGVIQCVEGEFKAEAVLILPESNGLDIVRVMVGDWTVENLSETEQAALSEIGKIVLNACIGTLTNLLGGDYAISPPKARVGPIWNVLEIKEDAHDETVILIFIEFVLARRQIHGHVAILQDIESMPRFASKVENFLVSAGL